RVVGALAAYDVVGRGGRPVEADLDVEVVQRRKLPGSLGRDAGAVGGELHPDPSLDGVGHQVEEVRTQHRFATTDVDVEHLHVDHVVDDAACLLGGELARVPSTRRAQAVHARQV